MSYPFSIKKVYHFDVYPSGILGNDFQNVTVLSIMDYESAIQMADIPAIHANVFPTLPAGTPEDPSATNYLKIRTANGQTTVLGLSWIKEETVQEVNSIAVQVTISGVATEDVSRIRVALAQNGFNNLDIKVINP
jgi:hypothetical protein